jgi:hypothetical protein
MEANTQPAQTGMQNTEVRVQASPRGKLIKIESGPPGEEPVQGEVRYGISYEELYTLKGRLLTLIDATFSEPKQCKAQKDLVWQTLKSWMEGIALGAENDEAGLEGQCGPNPESSF